ncbi:MAG TPA: hypothetical protein VK524_01195 [Polyangiaceae bacterium]|nr:hypothetical protein [Polyangiaceae bacterium]
MTAVLDFLRRVGPLLRAVDWRSKTTLYWTVAGALVIAFLSQERALGLTYPMPWPDEALFLWQALAVKDGTTLVAPELNAERPIFWMPYGYMVLQGLIFKITGFSLSWARMLSALYLGGTLLCLAHLASRFATRFASLALFAAFLSMPIVRFAGNTARMETLVALIAALGLVLLSQRRMLAGLATLSFAPLVHPNGQFVVFAGAVYVAGRVLGRRLAPYVKASAPEVSPSGAPRAALFALRNWEWLVAAGAALAWLLFLTYFARHSQDFLQDLTHQLEWKSGEVAESGTASWRIQRPWYWGPLLILAMASLPALRFAPAVLPFAALALALTLRSIVTVGWNYEYYTALAYACLGVVLVEVTVRALREGFPRARRLVPIASAGAGLLAVISLFRTGIHAPSLLHTVRGSTQPVQDHSRASYWSERDRAAVASYLLSEVKRARRPLQVAFFPVGDALLFADLRGSDLSFLHATRDPPAYADVAVLHVSVWQTDHQRAISIVSVGSQQEIGLPIDMWQVVSESPGNRWAVFSRAFDKKKKRGS